MTDEQHVEMRLKQLIETLIDEDYDQEIISQRLMVSGALSMAKVLGRRHTIRYLVDVAHEIQTTDFLDETPLILKRYKDQHELDKLRSKLQTDAGQALLELKPDIDLDRTLIDICLNTIGVLIANLIDNDKANAELYKEEVRNALEEALNVVDVSQAKWTPRVVDGGLKDS